MEPVTNKIGPKGYNRFLAKVIKDESDCWIWQGSVVGKGYGKLRYLGEYWLAHRFSYTYHYGPIPKWFVIRHKCHSPLCVNPEHLLAGTPVENVYDQIERGTFKPRHGKCKPIEYYRNE